MKKQLTLAVSLMLALTPLCSDFSACAKMSTESYKLFQDANVLEKDCNYSMAIEKVKSAIELSPDEAILYIKLGGLYTEMGDAIIEQRVGR